MKLKFGISLRGLQAEGTDTVVKHAAGLLRMQGDVYSIREFVSRTEGLLVEAFAVRVFHALLGILQHIAIRREGAFDSVA
ncbi:MAG: hypothetical protein IJA95_00275 [Bacteroidaceae bacterium]|nr:hypothetical protein [Bacteroidaceae bacterium]